MKLLRAKLKSRQGASIAMAMMFFLLCIMVCSIVITAATGNAGRFHGMRAESQHYFTASSAARLLRDSFEDYTYIVVKTTVTVNGSLRSLDYAYTPETGDLTDILNEAAKWIYDNGSQNLEEEVSVQASELPLVAGTMAMEPDYDVEILLSVMSAVQSRYPLCLMINAEVERDSRTKVERYTTESTDAEGNPVTETTVIRTTVETTTVIWQQGLITRGGTT